jgi:peptidyl-prolyl cis-trans isomerase B (cyclophilin B)
MLHRSIVFVAVMMLAAAAQAQPAAQRVQFDTSEGSFTVALDAEAAPKTVANFLSYVRSGFYKETIFHRVIKGFMIQGGGLTTHMQKKPTQPPVVNEADNGLQNLTGTIAMARTNDPNSATAQFFINVADNHSLNHSGKTNRGWGYCVFGRVIKGMEVVRAIENAKTTTTMAGRGDVPIKPIVINAVTILAPDKP